MSELHPLRLTGLSVAASEMQKKGACTPGPELNTRSQG